MKNKDIEKILKEFKWADILPKKLINSIKEYSKKNTIVDIRVKKQPRKNFSGISIDNNGLIFYRDGVIHSDDTPAIITSALDLIWYKDGDIHREDGPAEIRKVPGVSGRYYGWYKENKLHNENGPALIFFDPQNKIISREWFINGERHNENGPAVVHKDNEVYFINGEMQLDLVHSNYEFNSSLEKVL